MRGPVRRHFYTANARRSPRLDFCSSSIVLRVRSCPSVRKSDHQILFQIQKCPRCGQVCRSINLPRQNCCNTRFRDCRNFSEITLSSSTESDPQIPTSLLCKGEKVADGPWWPEPGGGIGKRDRHDGHGGTKRRVGAAVRERRNGGRRFSLRDLVRVKPTLASRRVVALSGDAFAECLCRLPRIALSGSTPFNCKSNCSLHVRHLLARQRCLAAPVGGPALPLLPRRAISRPRSRARRSYQRGRPREADRPTSDSRWRTTLRRAEP